MDEEAAWAQIVAAYGEEPADPPDPFDRTPGRDTDGTGGDDTDRNRDGDRAGDGDDDGDDAGDDAGDRDGDGSGDGPSTEVRGTAGEAPVRGFTVFPAGSGPRDWSPAEPSGGDLGEEDEGHFVPPEPPPLPRGDTVGRFAWLAVLGGPLLLMLTVLFRQDVTWWIATLGIGGFLGGFATLVTRLRDDDEDGFDDPGRGAVV
nr:hypothetical protein [Streptomyces taklimakanensis]